MIEVHTTGTSMVPSTLERASCLAWGSGPASVGPTFPPPVIPSGQFGERRVKIAPGFAPSFFAVEVVPSRSPPRRMGEPNCSPCPFLLQTPDHSLSSWTLGDRALFTRSAQPPDISGGYVAETARTSAPGFFPCPPQA